MACAVMEKTSAVASIAGGFVAVAVPDLMTAWRACQRPGVGVAAFRAWLALREMVTRRKSIPEGREPAYSAGELARLLDLSPKRARALVARLEDARLVAWSSGSITFPETPDLEDVGIADTLGGGRGPLAIPRRILRHLARGGRPATIAAALAVLLRCLSRRRSGFDGRGRVKASWIARVFDIDLRRAKAARAELVALGWVAPEPSEPWAERRWGRAFRIDLAWLPPGRALPPVVAISGVVLPPPDLDPDPLPGAEKNQEPASGRPAGASLDDQETGEPPPVVNEAPLIVASEPPPPQALAVETPPAPAASTALPAPRLDDVRPEDLADVGRTLDLHRQAVARGLADASEAGRLRFVALAIHSRAIGSTNPPGLFARLVRGGLWSYATQADEDTAARKIREHLHGPSRPRPRPAPRHPDLDGGAGPPSTLGNVMSRLARLAARFGSGE